MNLAKISANGQITVPVEIRRLLGLKSGDKILFFQKQDGEIVVSNASSKAIRKAQAAFAGVAEEMGVYSEDDIQALVDEVRYGKVTCGYWLTQIFCSPHWYFRVPNRRRHFCISWIITRLSCVTATLWSYGIF